MVRPASNRSAEKPYLKFGNTTYMSRVGKKPIALPEKTEITISGSLMTVKGPQGTLTREIPSGLDVKVVGQEVTVIPKAESPAASVTWGTFSSHLKNMIEGVVTPFNKKLLIEGVGYKWEVKGTTLHLNVGFSHPVALAIPADVKVVIEKGVFSATSCNKDSVGQFVSKVRGVKKPEPYKGKGIRYETEVIRRKEGKKTT